MNNLANKFRRDTIAKIKSLGSNALALAGALTDDSAPPPAAGSAAAAAADVASAEEKRDLPEQRILLCQALLGIGHLAPAFFILARWPVIAQYKPTVSDLLLRIVRYCMEDVADELMRGDVRSDLPAEEGEVEVGKEVVLTMVAPHPFDTNEKEFRFFYSNWTEDLRLWTRLEEVVEKVQPFAFHIGALGARDVGVLVRLIRIGLKHIALDVSWWPFLEPAGLS